MKTTIEMKGNEFTTEVFEYIQSFLKNKADAELRISINDNPQEFPPKETREEYFARLEQSTKEAEEGKVVSFTWDEFKEYTRQLLNEP